MSDSGVSKVVLKGELVTDSRGGGLEDPIDDGDWIGMVRLTESGERRELLSVLTWCQEIVFCFELFVLFIQVHTRFLRLIPPILLIPTVPLLSFSL
jgi:hypothetical protein